MTPQLDQFVHELTHKVFVVAVAATMFGGIAGLLVRWFTNWLSRFIESLSRERVASASADTNAVSKEGAPHCPKCNRIMVARTASKGARVGQRFWGCPAFPGCRATREMVAT